MKWFTRNKRFSSFAALMCSALFLTLLAACGTGSGTDTGSGDNASTNDLSTKSTVILLKHSPTGTAELSWDPGSHKLDVKISLTGLAPNSPHAAHIHAGSCAADGAVVYPLKSIVADAKGVGGSETIIDNVRNGIPAKGWYINIHNGLQMSPLEHRAISCGNIANSNTSLKKEQSVHVVLGDAKAPNESARGQAVLSMVNGKPTLKIILSGLEPKSTHVAHIHDGSCEAQGPVLVMLNPVVADAQGNGTSLTTFDHMPTPKNGLYVNVHTGAAMADLAQPTQFNPIACGNASPSASY